MNDQPAQPIDPQLLQPDSVELFTALSDAVPNQLWMCTPDGNIFWFNKALQDFTGLSSSQLMNEGWLGVIHPDDLATALSDMSSALVSGRVHTSSFRMRRQDGDFRWVLVRATPIRNPEGQIERWLGSNTDIHDQKLAEASLAEMASTLEVQVAERTAQLMKTQDDLRQSQKMETVGNLAGGVAHDFNNILQIVIGSIQLIRRNVELDETTRVRVDHVEEAVNRGARMASQLLGFSRRGAVQLDVLDPRLTISQIVSLIARALGSGVEFRITGEEDVWNVYVDRTNLENAVLNLAINSRDAMNAQGAFTLEFANVTLAQTPDVEAGDYVRIRATDTGSGMSPEIAARIFEPFFTTKPLGKGTGLGLAMVHGFVAQSQGAIRVESEVGKGTTFEILLPRTLREAFDKPEEAPARAMKRGSGTILLVEDDLGVRDTTAAMLLDLGYRVITARNAQDAFDRLSGGLKVDLVLTDVVMPGPLTSVELVERIGATQPDLPVIYTSGYAENLVVQNGQVAEGVELIFKPFRQEELAARIENRLAKPT